MSVSYNLSKVEDASIFLELIKNILVGPGPEFNSYSHGLNRVGISDCNLGVFQTSFFIYLLIIG